MKPLECTIMYSAISHINHATTPKTTPYCAALRPMRATLMDCFLWGRLTWNATTITIRDPCLKALTGVYAHTIHPCQRYQSSNSIQIISHTSWHSFHRAVVTVLLSEMMVSETHQVVGSLTSRTVTQAYQDINKHTHIFVLFWLFPTKQRSLLLHANTI